jgi:para-nitrobenzyl esterase
MNNHLRTAAIVCAVAFSAGGLRVSARLDAVKTDAGLVASAQAAGGVTAYLGIPYAAPPLGDLRWRPPQPAPHWDGVRKADHFGTSCMQNQAGSRLPWTEEFMTQGPIGEDCLFLNVWTAAKNADARLPVMFWIYGGGFNEGSSAVAVYDGTELARKDVVLVSVNYRVGPLGFLAHPELTKESEHHTSGNYGLLDQIAALQWVRRNIGAFGGDPDRVTIFGQSAGAISVVDLMRSPLAKGLFARAIAQSGPGLLPRNALGANATLSEREAAGVQYAESKGARSLAELRALPASAFFTSSAGSGGPRLPNGPSNDGWVLTETSASEQVPLTAGFVADDIGIRAGDADAAAKPTIANYQSDAERAYGELADAFLKLYPVAADRDIPIAQKAAARDRARVSMDVWAAEQQKASRRMFTYYFDRVLPWPAHPEFGAFHTSEVSLRVRNTRSPRSSVAAGRPEIVGHGLLVLDEFRQDRRPEWRRSSGMADLRRRRAHHDGARRSRRSDEGRGSGGAGILPWLFEEA